ncbi:MAG: glycosyltransferase [Acidimicrobiales bacterium]
MSLTTEQAERRSDVRAVADHLPSDADDLVAEPLGRSIEVSVVVPVFDEAATLASVADEVERALSELPGLAYEIVFVDDGSRDPSWAVMRDLATSGRPARAVVRRHLRRRAHDPARRALVDLPGRGRGRGVPAGT